MTRAAARAGYDLLISFQQLSGDWHTDYEDSRKADGIILLGYGDYEQYRPRLDQLVRQGTHFVRWGAPDPEDGGVTIGSDNRAGGRMAAEHLIAQGRRRIAFIGTNDGHFPEFRDRYAGYAEALTAAGLPVDPVLQSEAISLEEDGHAAALALLAGGRAFDGLVAASDLMAIGAMRALQDRGVRVPDDVAITGFDDIAAAHQTSPPLTTVRQDVREAGEALVAALVARIEGRAPPPRTALPVRLQVRASSGQHTNT